MSNIPDWFSCPHDQWNKCSKCKNTMKKKSVAELKPHMPVAFNNNFSLEVAFKEGYNFAITEMGRLGGSVKSDKKAKAVRENGKKGGRPKKSNDLRS